MFHDLLDEVQKKVQNIGRGFYITHAFYWAIWSSKNDLFFNNTVVVTLFSLWRIILNSFMSFGAEAEGAIPNITKVSSA